MSIRSPEKAAIYHRVWSKANPEKAAEYARRWAQAHPDKVRERNSRRVRVSSKKPPKRDTRIYKVCSRCHTRIELSDSIAVKCPECETAYNIVPSDDCHDAHGIRLKVVV